jgi:hypothetical protein
MNLLRPFILDFLIAISLSLIFSSIILYYTQCIYFRTGWSNFELLFVLLLCVIPFGLIVSFIYGGIKNVLFLRNPLNYYLSNKKILENSLKIAELVSLSAKRIGIEAPKIITTEGEMTAFVFETKKSESILVISKEVETNFDADELESIILHELYHTKVGDAKDRVYDLIFKNFINRRFVILLFSFLLLFFLSDVMFGFDFETNIANGQEAILFYNLSLSSLIILLSGGIVALLGIFTKIAKGAKEGFKTGFASIANAFQSELFADAFSALTILKPDKNKSAIFKMAGLPIRNKEEKLEGSKQQNKVQLMERKASFYRLAAQSNLGFYDLMLAIFESNNREKINYDRLDKRLELIKYIEYLVSEKVKLIVRQSEFPKLKKPIPPNVSEFVTTKPESLLHFVDYVKSNFNDFNLVNCAVQIGVTPYEAFLLFWAAVNSKMVDFQLS